jgi:hypothetical protein
MTGGTATAAAGEVAGQAVRTQRDDLEVPQPAERARGKAAGQPDAREAELDDRGVARDAGADTFQPSAHSCGVPARKDCSADRSPGGGQRQQQDELFLWRLRCLSFFLFSCRPPLGACPSTVLAACVSVRSEGMV